jgi:hypothetical protein
LSYFIPNPILNILIVKQKYLLQKYLLERKAPGMSLERAGLAI